MQKFLVNLELDTSSGYWQIKVDDATSNLLAFLTPKGRYKFKRLPFGIHSASEIFQVEIAQIINGINGVYNLLYGDELKTNTMSDYFKYSIEYEHQF